MPFGVDIKGLTARLEERFRQLIAEIRTLGDKLDTLIDLQRPKDEAGAITFGPILCLVLVLLAFTGLFAICGDEDEVDSWAPMIVASHDYCAADHDGCGDWGGSGSDGNTGYDGEGGRSGDMEQGDGSCRNFCNWTIPGDMMPGGEDRERR